MLVSQILKHKGDTVFTAAPSETISAVAALLHVRGVGALVVLDQGQVVGIVSERDVVRAMAERGAGALVGRPSTSRGITPEIDCAGDGAVSHRHAQLTLQPTVAVD